MSRMTWKPICIVLSLAACRMAAETAALAGDDPAALFEQARALDRPEGGRETLVEAARLYESAARGGHLAAMTRVGILYVMGEGVEEDEARGANWIRRAAEAAHPRALGEYGLLLAEGWGVEEDDVAAVAWYRKAAAAGDPLGLARLGFAYELGEGIEADPKQAKRWFVEARAALERDLRDLQTTGDPELAMMLGILLDEGLGGRTDDGRAVALYRQAAEAGHAESQFYLAGMLLEG
ncbi:MAG: sel1 repeat family protein, partial [Thermoanaerobaculia bacterium]|nr:sel1 repeat family protein [Thermoanaerobaculia bacterium]